MNQPQGQPIYTDDPERQMWRATLAEVCRRAGRRVHAWVLVGNHYHLLLETPEANLVNGMKWLCAHTTVARRRVSERLGMGHASRVTQGLRTARPSQDKSVVAWKNKSAKILESLSNSDTFQADYIL